MVILPHLLVITFKKRNIMKIKKEDTTESTEELIFKYPAKAFSPLDHKIVYVPQECEEAFSMSTLMIREKCGNEISIIEIPATVKALIETADEKLVFISKSAKGKLRVPEKVIINDDREPTMVNNPAALASFNAFNTQVASGTIVLSASFLGQSLCILRRSLCVYMTGKIEKNAVDLLSEKDREIRKENKCSKVRFCDTNQKSIEDTLSMRKFETTAMIALLLYGCKKFGPLWLMKHSPKGMLAPNLFSRHKTR